MKALWLGWLLAAASAGAQEAARPAEAPAALLKQGEFLVRGGAGKTAACAACHGKALKGAFSVPGLLGRPAGYIAMQLADIQSGKRDSPALGLMKVPVASLTAQDMRAIDAYLASLPP